MSRVALISRVGNARSPRPDRRGTQAARLVHGRGIPDSDSSDGDAPLIVISAGRVSWDAPTRASFRSYAAAQRAHVAEQARLAGLSRNSTLVVARASFHAVQFYEPEVITNAILQLLASAAVDVAVIGRLKKLTVD